MQTRSKPLQQVSWLQFDSAMLLFRIKPGPIREALRLHLVEVAALDEAADEAGATIEAARKGLTLAAIRQKSPATEAHKPHGYPCAIASCKKSRGRGSKVRSLQRQYSIIALNVMKKVFYRGKKPIEATRTGYSSFSNLGAIHPLPGTI